MGLRNLSFAEAKVQLPGGDSFTVRGVDPDMVVALYNRHRGELSVLFDNLTQQVKGENPGDVAMIAASAMSSAPVVMAELIALASGSKPSDTFVELPDGLTDWERDVAAARSLPFPVQVDALTKIAEQTFTTDMPVGKFAAVVIKAAGTATAFLTPQKN